MRKHTVCILCACVINVPRLEWIVFVFASASQFHLKAVLFFSVGLWVCVMVWDGLQGTDWGPASQWPLSYIEGVDGSQSTWESLQLLPLPTPLAGPAHRGEIPPQLPNTWKHKVRAVAKNSAQVEYLWAGIWQVGCWEKACLLAVCMRRDTYCKDKEETYKNKHLIII